MKKIALLVFTASVMLANQANANSIYLTIDNITSSSKVLISEIQEMSGKFVNTQTGELEQKSVSEIYIVILDSDNIVNNNFGLNKALFYDVQSIIIIGEPNNNRIVSLELLGYGISDDYLVITGVNEPGNRRVTHFDNDSGSSTSKVSKALLKAAML